MIWAVLVLAILVVAEGLYILLRDPRRGGSIGINGVSGDRKVSPAVEEAPRAEPELLQAGGSQARTSAEQPLERQPAAERTTVGKQAEEVAKAQPESPRAPGEKDESSAAGVDDWDAAPPAVEDVPAQAAAGPAVPDATAGDNDWDAAPPPLVLDDSSASAAEETKAEPEPEPTPATAGGDDWDAAPPPLVLGDSSTTAAEETKAPEPEPTPATAGRDDWDAAPPPLDDAPAPDAEETKATPEPEPSAAGGDDWATPPPTLDDAPAPAERASEPADDDLAAEEAREDTDDDQAETRTEEQHTRNAPAHEHDVRGADNVSNADVPEAPAEPAPADTPTAQAPAAAGGDDWATPPPPLNDTPAPEEASEPAKDAVGRSAQDDLAAEQTREDADDDHAVDHAEEQHVEQDGPLGPGSADPGDDGSGPVGWVKGDDNDMSFHSADSPGFDDAEASVWFKDEATARQCGFRHWDPSKR